MVGQVQINQTNRFLISGFILKETVAEWDPGNCPSAAGDEIH